MHDFHNTDNTANQSLNNLSGTLLVASPDLQKSSFQKSVVLVSAHNPKEGAMGVILNRPLGDTLGNLDTNFANSPLSSIHLYAGGPIDMDQMILTAWQWLPENNLLKVYFGITYDKACELLEKENQIVVKGFLGYVGWTYESIQKEVKNRDWLLVSIDERAMNGDKKEKMWQDYIKNSSQVMPSIGEMPDDLTLN